MEYTPIMLRRIDSRLCYRYLTDPQPAAEEREGRIDKWGVAQGKDDEGWFDIPRRPVYVPSEIKWPP